MIGNSIGSCLSAQPDHSVTIVSIGFVPCIAQLLESKPDHYSPLRGVELVRKKVKCLYVMGGIFGDAMESDYNFYQGISFSETCFNLWPSDVDVIFSPGEVGDAIEYKPDQVISDISWTDVHPIKQVYMRFDCNTGQKMWNPMPLIEAVEGDDLFSLSPRGNVTITPEGETPFTPDPNGNCRYQIPGNSSWADNMLQKIRNSTMQRGQ